MSRPRDLEVEAILGACRAANIGYAIDHHGALTLVIPATVPAGIKDALVAAIGDRHDRVIDFLSDPERARR
jgi:hypothetical protein